MSIEWDRPLRHRKGSRRRLAGLDVFYDFDWKQVFRHNRAVFPNGQSLAALVARECPNGKQATLLLTIREDVEAGIREVENRYIVIVPIQDYLRQAGADAASTYYARLSGTRLTLLSSLSDATFTQAELGQFLQAHLDPEALSRWADASLDNRAILSDVASRSRSSADDLLSILAGLSVLEPVEVEAIAARVRDLGGSDGTRRMLEVVTASSSGREVTVEVLTSRLEERIADARAQVTQYAQLIAQPGVTENDVQRFLEEHPWIVGLAYVRARPRVAIPRGEVDFVLERYDGFFDILELKGPDEPILVEVRQSTERPASASAYTLGPGLSKALAQAHLYRALLDQGRDLAHQYGLSDTRQPRVMIVVGRSSDLSTTAAEILRQLNLSLHRVEVLPYDILGRRTEGWLQNVEQLLPGLNTA